MKNYWIRPHCRIVHRHKFPLIMKIFIVFMLFFNMSLSAVTYSQSKRVNIRLQEVPIKTLFDEIQRQTGYYFVFNSEQAKQMGVFSLDVQEETVENVLKDILHNTQYTFKFEDDIIIIAPKEVSQEQPVLKGTVKDEKNLPLPGVTILVKGTSNGITTDPQGNFTIKLQPNDTLVFSFIGMKTQYFRYTGQKEITIILQEDKLEIDEVVVTGIFERKSESFTGATATFKAEELKRVGGQNVLQSLKTLDPSFSILESRDYGSDPNRLPDIEIRGKSSVIGLKEEFGTDPNQPLFILDGFETDLKTIVDLNMDRVASVTILKDAASTAIYGAKAAMVSSSLKRKNQNQVNSG